MSEPTTDGLRERLFEAVRAAHQEWLRPGSDAGETSMREYLADALLPVVEQHVAGLEAERDRYAAEVAEVRRDADLGWADAEKRQKESEEWAATWKRLNDYNTLLLAALARGTWPPEGQALVCGAVGITASGHLGPCTGGWHHESFPHQDATGARWQVLVLPADAEPDDLTARLAAAYYARFDNDGHPEDSAVAAEVAMTVLGAELGRLQADRDRYRSAWQSARERAQAFGEGIERLCDDRDSWKGWLRTAEAEVRRLTELVGQYADRGIANGQRAEAAEADRDRLAAEAESNGREADRLRKDYVEIRERAEKAEADRDRLAGEVERHVTANLEAANRAQLEIDRLRAESETMTHVAKVNGEGHRVAYQGGEAARQTVARVHAECDRIEAAVGANPQDPDFDGGYLSSLRWIRAALDGTGEAS